MTHDQEHIDELIALSLSSAANERQAEELRLWIDEADENLRYFERMRDIWLAAASKENLSRYDADEAFNLFLARIKTRKNRRLVVSLLRYAAILLLVFGVGYAAYLRGGSDVRGDFSEIAVEAPLGSTSKVTLPDGTAVTLNAGSRLSYSQGFGVESRDVRLSGEGYFEVAHKEDMPFRIITGKLDLRVVGTKFNFRCYDDEANIVVSLMKGSVELDNRVTGGAKTCLHPNEQAVMNKADGTLTVSKKAAAQSRSWADSRLVFEEETLASIAKTLERTYNVKVTINTDSLRSYKFYGIFNSKEQSIDDVLQALQSTNKIHYKRHGRQITIY